MTLPALPPQVGYRVKREDRLTKPELGHLKKHNAPAMTRLREFKVSCMHACLSDRLQASGMHRRQCLQRSWYAEQLYKCLISGLDAICSSNSRRRATSQGGS